MGSNGVLPDFQEFLISNKLAPEKTVVFMAIWVGKFLAFSKRKGQQGLEQTVSEYLNSSKQRWSSAGRQAAAVYCSPPLLRQYRLTEHHLLSDETCISDKTSVKEE